MEKTHLNESDMIPTTPVNEPISQEKANETIWNQLKKHNMIILEERLSDDLADINFSPDSYREEAIKYIVKQYGVNEMFIGKLLSIDQLGQMSKYYKDALTFLEKNEGENGFLAFIASIAEPQMAINYLKDLGTDFVSQSELEKARNGIMDSGEMIDIIRAGGTFKYEPYYNNDVFTEQSYNNPTAPR